MPKYSIHISKTLKARLECQDDENWSHVAALAFEKRLAELFQMRTIISHLLLEHCKTPYSSFQINPVARVHIVPVLQEQEREQLRTVTDLLQAPPSGSE